MLDQLVIADHQPAQGLDEILQVGEAVVWILGQHAIEDRLQRAQVVGQRRRWLQRVAHQHRHRVVASEWRRAGEHFVEEDAERVLVGTAIDLATGGLLGAHVGRRAEDEAGLRDARGQHIGMLGDAEIGQHRRRGIAEHHVRGFQVAMDDAVAVRILESIGKLHDDANRLAQGKSAAHAFGERAAFQQLHRDIGNVVAGDDVVDGDDIAMRQLGHGAAFKQEAPLEFRHRATAHPQLATHDLDRDLAVQRMLDGEVDGRHAALAQLADHFVARNVLEAVGHVPLPSCGPIIAKPRNDS